MNKRKENCKKYKFVFQDLIVFQRTPCHDSFAKCASYHLCSKCLHQIRISNHAEICAFRKKKKRKRKEKTIEILLHLFWDCASVQTYHQTIHGYNCSLQHHVNSCNVVLIVPTCLRLVNSAEHRLVLCT